MNIYRLDCSFDKQFLVEATFSDDAIRKVESLPGAPRVLSYDICAQVPSWVLEKKLENLFALLTPVQVAYHSRANCLFPV